MDTTELLKKLKQAVPGAVLENGCFGRTTSPSFWIEGRLLVAVAAFLKNENRVALDWLENLSVIEVEETLVASYFLRSTSSALTVTLRVSAVPPGPTVPAELFSVAELWAMAGAFEVEAGELFGIRFLSASGQPVYLPSQRLPQGWVGFPLRKKYVFPPEYLGISHESKP
ncbi:NADH-quinone oxidoreductase subunit C [Bdellovibrionota bacterium FG-1]